jgi:hypothetical protein
MADSIEVHLEACRAKGVEPSRPVQRQVQPPSLTRRTCPRRRCGRCGRPEHECLGCRHSGRGRRAHASWIAAQEARGCRSGRPQLHRLSVATTEAFRVA